MKNNVFDVRSFGAVSDGKTLNSKAVQLAIDECAKQGGGKVVFSKGDYCLSTVFLKSNVEIVIKKDARILGSQDFYDYAPQEKLDYPLYQDASHSYFDCSMFVGKGCENIAIYGGGIIDMRSVWDKDNVRDMVHRGPKCIALRECKNVDIHGIEIYHATDLAIYFAGCDNVEIHHLKMRVYIDGISPDNSSNVNIYNCDIETGDDGIVFKSSYTLNKLGVCENIIVKNCRVKSRCSALKFGTETNGGFRNIYIENVDIRETRITGIAIESVDGAIIDCITIKNVSMRNVGAPLFIHLGNRMRGPEGRKAGKIENILLENIVAEGPYEPYECIEWRYSSFVKKDTLQYPWQTEVAKQEWGTPFTNNVCGLKDNPLRNITLKNVKFITQGGIQEYQREVPENADGYPEVFVYGHTLPAHGIYFRYVDGLILENVEMQTYLPDVREAIVFDGCRNLSFLGT